MKHDDEYLRKIGVDLSVLGKEMFDTQVLQAYRESLREREKYFMRGLSHLLKEYSINYQESQLHNAGCDAFYTMMVFLRQMDYTAKEVNAIVAKSKYPWTRSFYYKYDFFLYVQLTSCIIEVIVKTLK